MGAQHGESLLQRKGSRWAGLAGEQAHQCVPNRGPLFRCHRQFGMSGRLRGIRMPGRIRQIRSFFRARPPYEMLDTAAPWTSPWLPPGYEQNFWNACNANRDDRLGVEWMAYLRDDCVQKRTGELLRW